jgi:hypothetical protein
MRLIKREGKRLVSKMEEGEGGQEETGLKVLASDALRVGRRAET